MKINEFKKALYKALELKIYIDKNDFGDLQNKNMLNKDLGGALSDVINVLNDEINKMKYEIKKYSLEYTLSNGDWCQYIFKGTNKSDAIKTFRKETGLSSSKIISVSLI